MTSIRGETTAGALLEELCFDEAGLLVQTARDGDQLDSRVAGVAELSVRERLAGYLQELHARAAAEGVKQVVMDLGQLEFMNAACFRAFVSWIQELQELPHTRQYLIRFRSNRDLPWQRRSINALKCFATDLISVEAGA
jgi:hypothetical protein